MSAECSNNVSNANLNLNFILRGPTWISLDNPNPLPGSTGVCILNVSFQGAVTISSIHFKNYYTSTITVKYKIFEDEILSAKSFNGGVDNSDYSSSNIPWKTFIDRKQLMPDANYEDGSQNYFTINSNGKTDLIRVTSMVIILRQPSYNWKTFAINELTIFGRNSINTVKMSPKNEELVTKAEEQECKDEKELDLSELKNILKDINNLFL